MVLPYLVEGPLRLGWSKNEKGAFRMKVKDIETPKVAFVRSDESIKQAALKMEELGEGVKR